MDAQTGPQTVLVTGQPYAASVKCVSARFSMNLCSLRRASVYSGLYSVGHAGFLRIIARKGLHSGKTGFPSEGETRNNQHVMNETGCLQKSSP